MTFISFEFFLFLPVAFGGFRALGRWRFAQRAFLIARRTDLLIEDLRRLMR